MVFASLEFLTLFLPAFMLVYALGKPQWRNVILLLGSWLFFGWLTRATPTLTKSNCSARRN